jgi:hypothetical protein
MSSDPRGIRNNNPGNIRRSSTLWAGQQLGDGGDSQFVTFTEPAYGIRAICKTLMTYQSVHNLYTVSAVIARWAPPLENDTASYVDSVCHAVGIGPHDHIDLTQGDNMKKVVCAIIRHENGQMPYDEATLTRGLHLAGIADSNGNFIA